MRRITSKTNALVGGAVNALFAVIIGAISMMTVGTILLSIPGVSLSIANPESVTPTFYISIMIILIGAALITIATRKAFNTNSKLIDKIDRALEILENNIATPTSMSGEGIRGGSLAQGGRGHPRIIRQGGSTSVETREPVTKRVSKPASNTMAPARQTTKELQQKKPKSKKEEKETLSFDEAINRIVERYNEEKVRKKFGGWYNTLMMTFTDLDKSFLYVINGDEGIDLSEGVDEDAAVKVELDSELFTKMLSKQVNAIKAYSSGALKVQGKMKNLLKLRKLMF